MKTLVRIVIVLVIFGVAGAGLGYWWIERLVNTPADPSGAAKPVDFRVQPGSATKIGMMLHEQGLLKSLTAWKYYQRVYHPDEAKVGRHEVHAGMTIPELCKALAGPPISDDVPLTMVEGWRLRDADAWLAEKKLITAGDYVNAASNPAKFKIPFPFSGTTLEGYLYPETYKVPQGPLDVDKLIQRQIDAFNERFVVPYKTEIDACGRSIHELVIAASMLEREEPVPAQRNEVAGVFYKRLSLKIPLGVDATSRYNLVDWNDRPTFLASLRDPNEPYNTRLRQGLPPGPIGAPSIESLLAALRPQKTDYLYYLHDSERKIHFAKTAAEHEANRKKYNVY